MFPLLYFLFWVFSLTELSNTFPLLIPRDTCPWSGSGLATYDCESYVVSKQIPGSTLNIWRLDGIAADSNYLGIVEDASTEVMSLYQDFIKGKSLEISFYVTTVITDEDSTDATLAEATQPTESTCVIQISTQSDDGTSSSPIGEMLFKQTVAHELYHCIQSCLGKEAADETQDAISNWWIEGTAEYFANQFYPIAGIADSSIAQYDPALPLYNATVDGDTAALFFQYLANSAWTDQDIHDWMAKQPFTNTFEAEISKISADTEFASRFHTFATHFIDGKIHFKDGTAIPNEIAAQMEPASFQVPVTNGAPFDYVVDTVPWVISSYEKTQFKQSQTVSITFATSAESDTASLLQYRKAGDDDWKSLKPGESADLQTGTSTSADQECSKGDEWNFLVTSTFDPALTGTSDDKAHTKISFTVTEPKRRRDESCDQCLVGDWQLDIASMQEYLTQIVASSSVSITDLTVTGSSTFTVTKELASTLKFTDLVIGYDASGGGISFHTDIDITGTMTGQIVLSDNSSDSSFTWTEATQSGTASTVTTLEGFDPIELDFDISEQYGADTVVKYVCDDTTLQMAGYVNDQYVWAYTWIKG